MPIDWIIANRRQISDIVDAIDKFIILFFRTETIQDFLCDVICTHKRITVA